MLPGCQDVCACQYPQTNKFSLSLSQPFLHFPLFPSLFFYIFFSFMIPFFTAIQELCSFYLQSALGETFVQPLLQVLASVLLLLMLSCNGFCVLLVAAFNVNPYKHKKKKAQRNVTQEIKLWRTLAAMGKGPLDCWQGVWLGKGGRGKGFPFALLWCHRSLLFLLFDNYRTAHKSTLALVSANKME